MTEPRAIPETVLGPVCPAARAVDLPAAVESALQRLGRFDRLTVLVNDPQRHTSSPAVLEDVLRRVEPSRARLLVAAGTHSFPLPQRQQFERSLLASLPAVAVAWHNCRDENLTSIGGVWRGHPWLLEAGAVLAVGSVEPHYFAGLTGAHKTATVGCAAHDDVQANHAHALSPACRPGRLAGNPVYEGVAAMLAALEGRQRVAVVNLVQAGDRVLAAEGGAALTTLQRLAPLAEEVFIHRLDAPFDAVIAEVAGPLGASFYQADKGIKNNEWAVRDGGVFVLVAPCSVGIGQDHFVRLLRQAATYDQAVAAVQQRGYRLGDHKAVRLRYLTDPSRRGVQVFAVSEGLRDEDASLLGLRRAGSVEDALLAAGIDPRRHRVLRLKDAGNLCALPRET